MRGLVSKTYLSCVSAPGGRHPRRHPRRHPLTRGADAVLTRGAGPTDVGEEYEQAGTATLGGGDDCEYSVSKPSG